MTGVRRTLLSDSDSLQIHNNSLTGTGVVIY